MKKQEFKKTGRGLGTYGTILNILTPKSIGVPEGEEEEQKIENLFEQIMKENFPNLAKEIDFQEVQEAQRVPRSWTQRSTHQGTSSLSYPRLKIRRESYKQQEERRQLPTKEFP